jgi:hypothetical protein
MNYHIITQDKFFDAYIEDIYKLHQEANNVFWVRGEEGELPWFTSQRKVEYLGNEYARYVEKLRTLNPQDKLFVSWYDMFIGQAILDSGINNDVYVSVMGGDFYSEPFWYQADWLFDRKTLKYLKSDRRYGYPQINWKRRPKNWGHVYDEICLYMAFMPQQRLLYQQKQRQLRRINYLILPQENRAEYDFIRTLYPGITCKFVYGSYMQNYDAANLLPTNYHEKGRSINILLGNSADPSNNYLDAFVWLKKQIKRLRVPVYIHTILSYGDEKNRELVIQKGKTLFGENFKPILSFMKREEYIAFLNSMDMLVMYHNRQQAVGNMMTSITLGKPVLMKACSPIYTMLKEQGCSSVYDVKKVNFENIEQIIQSANRDRANNVAIVKKIYSEETRLNNWRELLE